MPKAFDKFRDQVLANEEPIKISGNRDTHQGAEVQKMTEAALQEKEENEDTCQVTIKMKRSIKRALNKLKAESDRKIIDLTEEALLDLLKKYGQDVDM